MLPKADAGLLLEGNDGWLQGLPNGELGFFITGDVPTLLFGDQIPAVVNGNKRCQ